MVAPVITKSTNVQTLRHSTVKSWESQKPPYNLRLDCTNWYSWAVVGDSRSWAVSSISSPLAIATTNKAHARFMAVLGDTSQLGSTIAAEWRSTTGMIRDRAIQLFRFTRALRKGHLFDAASILNLPGREAREAEKRALRKKSISRIHKGKATVKDFGSLWLEYSYGWAPTCSDIYNATQVIDRPLPNITVGGKATGSRSTSTTASASYSYQTDTRKWRHSVHMIADVQVSNPNLFLSNQLGLTNPAQWVLEGIPFSFVLDWFSNLSQWVNQLTGFLGLTLSQAQTSSLVTYSQYVSHIPSGKPRLTTTDKGFTELRRRRGITAARLRFGYEIPNWKRGLNAISLLTQALNHKVQR